MEYRRAEIRAGVFLLLSFIVLVIMVFAVSDIQSLFKKKKEIRALFLFSDGIEKNAQVRFSGIKIGKVEDIAHRKNHNHEDDEGKQKKDPSTDFCATVFHRYYPRSEIRRL